MKKSRKLLLMLAFLLIGLQTACTAAGTESAVEEKQAVFSLADEQADKTEGALPQPEEEEALQTAAPADDEFLGNPVQENSVLEEGCYTGKEEVALYLHLYGHLPDNYITKKEAKNLGWDSSAGNLWEVAPGMSIGGDYFGNYEGLLPEDEDRDYFECDIDYDGGRRNAKRIIYSDDGLIFYTEDHYESFEQLY